MPWNLAVARSAEKQLWKTPAADQRRILSALEQMRTDPLLGDMVRLYAMDQALRWKVGNYRIFFDVSHQRVQF